MKYYTYERADLPKFIGILIFFGWALAQNAKVTLYVIACGVALILLLYAIFLLMDLDFDRERDAVEADIPFVDSYDEYRQTGVDRRKEKSSSSEKPDNPGQLCQPCQFTGVANMEAQVFEWGDWSDNKKQKI
jgi:hypothetical protein